MNPPPGGSFTVAATRDRAPLRPWAAPQPPGRPRTGPCLLSPFLAQVLLASLALVLLGSQASPALAGQARVHTFFKGTQYPLKVYVMKGEQPGPTIMVQGGIQGDERSGYITAQLLTRCRVDKGNLIVIPRANVPSINAGKRLVNVDLNRRFDKEYNDFYEDRLARVIRFFLAQGDAFVHLHEGSGFYHPEYVDNLRGPHRWGQSIIIDARVYKDVINLEQYAGSVCEQLNADIPKKFHFQVFNTRTFESGTVHAEQRKSLTFYALGKLQIPALAVEVSKDIIQLDWKVEQQLAATVLLLSEFGVEVEVPEIDYSRLKDYPASAPPLSVNGQPVVPGETTTLSLSWHSPLRFQMPSAENDPTFEPVTSIFASDRPGLNLATAPRMALSPFSSMEIRADGRRLGRIRVDWSDFEPPTTAGDYPWFVCWVNGRLKVVPAGQALDVVIGDQIILEGVWGSGPEEVLNFKGHVSDPVNNSGQDIGHEIIMDPDIFIRRYLEQGEVDGCWLAHVVRETPGTKRTSFVIRMVPRHVEAVKLIDETGRTVLVPFSRHGHFRIRPGRYTLADAWSNGEPSRLMLVLDKRPLEWGEEFELANGRSYSLSLRHQATFIQAAEMTISAREAATVTTRPNTPIRGAFREDILRKPSAALH